MIPAYSNFIYTVCSRYVDNYNGDNNSDSTTNGEENYLHRVLPILNDQIVFDVGANVGNWSQSCLSINPLIKLHLFEPSKPTFNKLAQKSWHSKVVMNNFGLGSKSETLQLHIVDENSGINSIHQRTGIDHANVKFKEDIQINTIDDYCEKNAISRIVLLKADVEGHELEVFKGAEKMLKNKCINTIQFEYGGCNLDARVYLLDIWNYLSSFGFSFGKIHPNHIQHIDRYTQSLETFKYSNWIATIND